MDNSLKNYIKSKDAKILKIYNEKRVNNIKIECSCGKIWLTNKKRLMERNQWCPSCSSKQYWEKQKDKYLLELKRIAKERGGKLLSNEYRGHKDKLLWECQYGHQWWTSSDVVKNGKKWCPYCSYSYGENISRIIFEAIFNKSFPTKKPSWLKNPMTGKKLELDGYNKDLKLAFEYNGVQHYNKKNTYNKKNNYYKSVYRDTIKKDLCSKNGVILIIIPYTIKYDKIKEYIFSKLQQNNIQYNSNVKINYNDVFKKTKNSSHEKKFQKKIKNLGYELISKYEGYLKPVTLKCKNGHKFSILARSVDRNKGCPVCRGYRKKDTLEIKKICKDKNLMFMDKQYIPGKRFTVKCLNCKKSLKIRHADLQNYKCKCRK